MALALGAGCHQAASASQTAATQPPPFTNPPMLTGAPDVAALVAKVKPAVVSIATTRDVKLQRYAIPGFGGFGGGSDDEGDGQTQHSAALGSGIIVDAQGHVVTNAHVIDDATTVKVHIDDRDYRAKVVGKDPRLDIAVLQIENPPKDLPVASLGASEQTRVGEYVVAIGNPFGLGNTVTMGIVSAKGRVIGAGPYDDFIQTDASINPGNSGGPLFDLHGQVIGINTAINPNGKGIGFAIPIDAVKGALPQLIANGRVARGQMGVMIQGMDDGIAKALGMDHAHGALVEDVGTNSPAQKAGIQSGDVITSVDGQDVKTSNELPRIIASRAPGTHVHLGVLRDKHTQNVDVTLEAMKDEGAKKDPSAPSESMQHGALGLAIGDEDGHAVVERVSPDGPADGKLRRGDVIEEVNKKPVTGAQDAVNALKAAKTGDALLLKVKRGDASRFVAIEP
jgi:serine protease Do